MATTRPETMLGDTAVAVHPGDERTFNLAVEVMPTSDTRTQASITGGPSGASGSRPGPPTAAG